MDGEVLFALIQLVLRIIGVVVCSKQATKLNRDSVRWGLFGFLIPIIAIIWIFCLKPIIAWDKETPLEKK